MGVNPTGRSLPIDEDLVHGGGKKEEPWDRRGS